MDPAGTKTSGSCVRYDQAQDQSSRRIAKRLAVTKVIDQATLEALFDEVSTKPESARGYNVDTICRLLAEAAKERFSPSEYGGVMRRLEDIYISRFIHTISVDPGFLQQIRAGITHFL